MKKRIIISLIIVFCLLLTGCDNSNKTNDNEKAKNNNVEEIKFGMGKHKNVNCNEVKDIVDYNNNQNVFITSDGSLYRLSIYKVFSNEKSCIKVDSEVKFKRILSYGVGNTYLLSTDDKVYEYRMDENKQITLSRGGEMFNSLNLDLSNLIWVDNLSNFQWAYYKTNEKKVYKCDYEYKCNELLMQIPEDEIVEYISEFVIKTDKNIYSFSYKCLNKEQCEKYEDADCQCKMNFYKLEDKLIMKNFDKILFYSPNLIIDTDGNFHAA